MNNLLNNAVIKIPAEKYLSLLIIFVPLLNFLSGITFDLHAPSLPAIADYFSAPISSAKNTITYSLLGFSIGGILFGTLLDIFGRRRIILLGLFIYTAASFLAAACHTIDQLLWVRFIQGFSVSCASIGCRTIVIDIFTGHQFKVALLYTSLAFGIGPIIAPFIGGYLQYHFGWKANFIAYGLTSLIIMIFFALFVAESKKPSEKFSFNQLYLNYVNILRHHSFFPGIMILGLSYIQLLVYTVTGAFLVENVLHHTAITYGNSALMISCGYLFGTLTNRFLFRLCSVYTLIKLGFGLLFAGIVCQVIFSLFGQLNLFTIILPIAIIQFSNGFIFLNIFTCCLRLSHSAGIATALFTSSLVLIGTLGTNLISHIDVSNLAHLAAIFGTIAIIELFIFTFFFRHWCKEMD